MSFTTDLMKDDQEYNRKINGLVQSFFEKINSKKIKLEDIKPQILQNLVLNKIKES